MPRSEREIAQIKLKQIISHINIIGENAFAIRNIYEKAHPDIAAMMDSIMLLANTMIELVEQIKRTF